MDGVSLKIEQGQTVAIVGESGCGKSTTGNAALGMAPITDGKILYEGRDLSLMTKVERRKLWQEMQVVFQDPVAARNPRLSIARSIAEPLVVNGWSKARIDQRVDELMALVGLNPDQRSRRPTALSGGQRQRVVIARALALSPLPGCPVASRCPNVIAQCSAARPDLLAISDHRKLRCINPDKV